MDLRSSLIDDHLTGRYTKTALAEAYGISRQKVHKWIKRFEEGGRAALADASRAPKRTPNRTSQEAVELILGLRQKRPRWGVKKILPVLRERHPKVVFPAERTAHELLRANGLVRRRRQQRRFPRGSTQITQSAAPNEVWSVDFKGSFKLGNGKRCHPLTVADHFSRYLLCCHALDNEGLEETQKVLTRVFKEYGLPSVMRSDNGPPFGSQGVQGFSRLSVWLIKLGIRPEHIEPGRPDQNGRQERMHRDLKAETTKPPRHSLRAQQSALRRFRKDFNEVRPHEALGQIPPARVYEPSLREFPRRVQVPEYPAHYETRMVLKHGVVSWRGHRVKIGCAFRGQRLGLHEVDDGLWVVQFSNVELGLINDRNVDAGLLPRP